jgi:MFS family permease
MAATQLDTAVNVAFPAITRGFDLVVSDIQWVVICYVLTYASLLLALGRIGDIIGHALIFRIGLATSAVALTLVGFSPNYAAMLFFRCLQGIGAALVLSCSSALLISAFGEDQRIRALGAQTTILSLGLMLGPLLGGVLTGAWDWPAVFWFRVPIALAALALLRTAPREQKQGKSEPFDFFGATALIIGLVTMLLTINRLQSLSGLWMGLLSATALAIFVFRESRSPRPIIPVEVLRRVDFAIPNVASLLANLAAFSVWLVVPYFLARIPGYSLIDIGVIMSTAAAGAVIAGPIGGYIAGRYIRADRLAIVGAASVGAGLLLLGAWTDDTPAVVRAAGLAIQGVGLGIFQLAYSDIVTGSLSLRDRGVAGSLVLLTRTFGNVTAASLILLVFGQLNASYGFVTGFQKTFQFAALVAIAAAGLMAFSPRNQQRPS